MRRKGFAKRLAAIGALCGHPTILSTILVLAMNLTVITAAALAMNQAHAAETAKIDPVLDFESIVQIRWNGVIPFPPQKIVEDLLSLRSDIKDDRVASKR